MSIKTPLPEDILVGQQVRKHRLAREMSQTDLANHLGITFQQVQKYEKGVNRISAGRLQVIAQLFEVDIREMMGQTITAQQKKNKQRPRDVLTLLGQTRDGHRLANAFLRLDDFHDLRVAFVVMIEQFASTLEEFTAKA